jgi:hypothetical protein
LGGTTHHETDVRGVPAIGYRRSSTVSKLLSD